MAVTLRPALPSDAARLTAIALAAKRHWGYPEAWIEAWIDGLTFTPDYIRAHHVTVAEADGLAVACAVLEGVSGEIGVEHVWVDPPWIGRGIGRRLFEHAVASGREMGATALVIHSDPHAGPFYERMGCEPDGTVRADVCGEARELPCYRYALTG